MAKKKKPDCDGVKGRMCGYAKTGKLKKIKKYAQKPRYICKKCARVSDCEDNLCKPKSY